MCEVRKECERRSRFWVQVEIPRDAALPHETAERPGRSLTTCARHLTVAVAGLQATRDRLLSDMGRPVNTSDVHAVTVKSAVVTSAGHVVWQ